MNHAVRTSLPATGTNRFRFVALIVCTISSSLLVIGVNAQDSPKTLSVPVFTVTAEPTDSEGPEMEMRYAAVNDGSQPTLPDAKLPQYHFPSQATTAETIDPSTVRFLLALPAEPILIEARITIDGEPYLKKREARVQSALEEALKPEPETPEPSEADVGTLKPLRAEKPASEGESADPETVEVPDANAYRSAGSNIEKLRRYIASIGREPSPEEAHWFFNNRLDGPTLLLLKDSFQAFRSDQTPVFRILDRDRDGVISSTEIDQAVESFHDCDLNRNDVVDYLEIGEAANDPRLRSDNLVNTSPLLYLLPTEQNAAVTYVDLVSRYDTQQEPAVSLPARFDANTNGLWEADELKNLRSMPADITLEVSFDSNSPGKSTLSITPESSKSLDEQQVPAELVNTTIVLHRPDCELWLSGIQLSSGDQVSLGAVNDGYPMLPVLDPNNDGRFTIRELRGVTKALRQFDLNGDGQILKAELRPTIRVSFGLNGSVHQTLAGVRSVHPTSSPSTAGPAWFVRMDRNKDNDLSRKEFPGTDEQFALLDTDSDKLISAEEALASEEQKNSTKQPEKETPVN